MAATTDEREGAAAGAQPGKTDVITIGSNAQCSRLGQAGPTEAERVG